MVTPSTTANGQENFSFLCVSNSLILLYVLGEFCLYIDGAPLHNDNLIKKDGLYLLAPRS